jgi:hypothetical protein
MGGDAHGDASQAYADALAALKRAASGANLDGSQTDLVNQMTQTATRRATDRARASPPPRRRSSATWRA